MLNSEDPIFPNNIVVLVAAALENIDPDITVLKRPLRPTDPGFTAGVFASLWDPQQDSLEMGHVIQGEPTLNRYQLGVQAMIKDGDEERGLATHSVFSKRVRSVLYRNAALRVALSSLFVTDALSTERTTRWDVRTQRYMNNDIEGKFVYVSTLEFWLETETS